MNIGWNSIKENRPALFDWLVFTISLLMTLIFPKLSDLTASVAFSSFMLVALILYITGLWLKHRPVYHRLAKIPGREKGVSYVIFLLIGHWILMLVVVMIAEGAFRQMLRFAPVAANEPMSGFRVFGSIVIAAFITWFAFRPGGKTKKPLTEQYLFRRELLGDIILISAVSLFSFVFWEKSLLGAMAQMRMDSIGDVALLFIFLSFAYMLFYLPLRYMYLIEDHKSRQAWKRLLLIFMLILVRGLFEALS